LIQYRPFTNFDPPALAKIWNASLTGHGVMQPVTAWWLECCVYSKLYFDREGLIVAVDGKDPIGFAHAGFGPDPDRNALYPEVGVTCLIAVLPQYRRRGIGKELLARCERYLKKRGAGVFYAGSFRPMDPYYLGLYGGSEMPGALLSLPDAHPFLLSQGYREQEHITVLECDLNHFSPIVDRKQLFARRATNFDLIYDPPPSDWWDACTYGNFERVRFLLQARTSGDILAQATIWAMEPLSSLGWGSRAVGLMDVEVKADRHREGYASYLLSESLRRLHDQGFSLVQAHFSEGNDAAEGLFNKLGFVEVDQGIVYVKT